jgi:hypothetical protein
VNDKTKEAGMQDIGIIAAYAIATTFTFAVVFGGWGLIYLTYLACEAIYNRISSRANNFF